MTDNNLTCITAEKRSSNNNTLWSFQLGTKITPKLRDGYITDYSAHLIKRTPLTGSGKLLFYEIFT